MRDSESIGAGRAYGDPADYLRAKYGTYNDSVNQLSDADKLPLLPRTNQKMPFKGMTNLTSGQRE